MMSSWSPSAEAVVSSGPVMSSACASANTTTGGGASPSRAPRALTRAAPIAVGTAKPTAASCGGRSSVCAAPSGAARPEQMP
eukprot:865160-Prymnesium_polylepis.1